MERRNDVPNLLAMYIRNTREIYNITSWLHDSLIKKNKQGRTTTIRIPCQLQRDENHNQRGCQTVIQVRRDNTHQTGKTGSGPGARRIYT